MAHGLVTMLVRPSMSSASIERCVRRECFDGHERRQKRPVPTIRAGWVRFAKRPRAANDMFHRTCLSAEALQARALLSFGATGFHEVRYPLSRSSRPMVHYVQQHSAIVVAPDGGRYVARTYAAPRPNGRWDGWFVFLPLDGGRELTTNWETTQQTLAQVKYWAESITTVYLEGALRRALARCAEVLLGRRAHRAEQQEALATAAAAAHEQAAAAANLA